MRVASSALCRLLLFLIIIYAVAYSATSTHPTAQQTQAQTGAVQQRAAVDELILTVTVTNKNRKPLTGLSKSDFTVLDEKAPQEITSFSGEDEPHSVGMLFDSSGSLEDANMNVMAGFLLNDFIEASNAFNDYFVFAFSSKPQLLLDWTRSTEAFSLKLPAVQMKGQTALYDSIYEGIEKLKTGRHAKRTLILVSDCQDNSSKHNFQDVRELLKESDVALYVILVFRNSDPGSPLAMEGESVAKQLASVTGGEAFYPTSNKQLKEMVAVIASEMRHQYRIGFKPAAIAGKPKWHSIKVRVKPQEKAAKEFKNLVVLSREGYYPDKGLR